jgi:hypothetical protein
VTGLVLFVVVLGRDFCSAATAAAVPQLLSYGAVAAEIFRDSDDPGAVLRKGSVAAADQGMDRRRGYAGCPRDLPERTRPATICVLLV